MAISLDSIMKGMTPKPPRVVLYGTPGIGKTSFGASAPKPIFIQTEDGASALSVAKFPLAKSFEDVLGALNVLATEDHDYQTVVIDTLDKLEELIFAQVAKDKGKNNISDIGFHQGYTLALDYWQKILDALDALVERGIIPVLLAHVQIKKFDAPDVEAYDRYRLNLHDKGAAKVLDWCDVMLFANYKIRTKSADGKAKALNNDGERWLYAEERPQHWAKNRYRLDYQIPFIEGGAFTSVISQVEGYFANPQYKPGTELVRVK